MASAGFQVDPVTLIAHGARMGTIGSNMINTLNTPNHDVTPPDFGESRFLNFPEADTMFGAYRTAATEHGTALATLQGWNNAISNTVRVVAKNYSGSDHQVSVTAGQLDQVLNSAPPNTALPGG